MIKICHLSSMLVVLEEEDYYNQWCHKTKIKNKKVQKYYKILKNK
jgi:hypothetical protein